MIYIISDTHFFHKNIIEYCDRPYKTTDEMNLDIVSKWNSIITPNDIVFHLGDVGFGLVEILKPLIESLNGHKILIRGNHDVKRGISSWQNIGFDIVYKQKKIYLQDILKDIEDKYGIKHTFDLGKFNDILFSHPPKECEDNILNVHGHIHNIPLDLQYFKAENHFCASIEMIGYKPIPLQDILNNKNKKE